MQNAFGNYAESLELGRDVRRLIFKLSYMKLEAKIKNLNFD